MGLRGLPIHAFREDAPRNLLRNRRFRQLLAARRRGKLPAVSTPAKVPASTTVTGDIELRHPAGPARPSPLSVWQCAHEAIKHAGIEFPRPESRPLAGISH